MVVLLTWLYYSAQIFLFGAEFTQAYANRCAALGRDCLGVGGASAVANPPKPAAARTRRKGRIQRG